MEILEFQIDIYNRRNYTNHRKNRNENNKYKEGFYYDLQDDLYDIFSK